MRKITALLMTVALLVSLSTTALAGASNGSETSQKNAADALYSLGLFLGTGEKNGVPQYELNAPLTRAHAIILLVRMLGKENEALNGTWSHPFQDTAAWYDKYVGYAYQNGLTNGTSDSTYSGDLPTTKEMFATFCLRSLGYTDQDFNWKDAPNVAKDKGFAVDGTGDYTRGNAVSTFWSVLSAKVKGTNTTLAQKLISDGAFTSAGYDAAKKIAGGTTGATNSGAGSSGGGSGSSGVNVEKNDNSDDNDVELDMSGDSGNEPVNNTNQDTGNSSGGSSGNTSENSSGQTEQQEPDGSKWTPVA